MSQVASLTATIRIGRGLLEYYKAKRRELELAAEQAGNYSLNTEPEWSNITFEAPVQRYVFPKKQQLFAHSSATPACEEQHPRCPRISSTRSPSLSASVSCCSLPRHPHLCQRSGCSRRADPFLLCPETRPIRKSTRCSSGEGCCRRLSQCRSRAKTP